MIKPVAISTNRYSVYWRTALAATRIAQVVARVVVYPVAAVHFGPGQAVATTPGLLLPARRRRIAVVRAACMRRRAVAAGVVRRIGEGGAAANAVAVVRRWQANVWSSWRCLRHGRGMRRCGGNIGRGSVNEYGCARHFPEHGVTCSRRPERINGSRPGSVAPQPPPSDRNRSIWRSTRPRAMRPTRTPHLPVRPGPKAHRENRSCRNGRAAAPPRGPRSPRACAGCARVRAPACRQRSLGLAQCLQHRAVKARAVSALAPAAAMRALVARRLGQCHDSSGPTLAPKPLAESSCPRMPAVPRDAPR